MSSNAGSSAFVAVFQFIHTFELLKTHFCRWGFIMLCVEACVIVFSNGAVKLLKVEVLCSQKNVY